MAHGCGTSHRNHWISATPSPDSFLAQGQPHRKSRLDIRLNSIHSFWLPFLRADAMCSAYMTFYEGTVIPTVNAAMQPSLLRPCD